MKIKKTLIIVSLILMLFLILGSVSAINPEIGNNTQTLSTNNNLIQKENHVSNNLMISEENSLNAEENVIQNTNTVNLLGTAPTDGVYYVNNNNTESPDGSYDKPYNNITDAVNNISADNNHQGNFIVNIQPGTYTESNIQITKNITFTKTPNTNGEIKIDGNQGQIFNTNDSEGVVYNIIFNNLTLTNAMVVDNGSVINIKNGYLKINNCILENNTAKSGIQSVYGGAIFVGNGNVTVTNSNFTNNTAIGLEYYMYSSNNYGCGGAIYVKTGNVTVNSSFFTNNKAIGKENSGESAAGYGCGGVIFVETGNVTVNSSSFVNNSVEGIGEGQSRAYGNGYGGAIYVKTGNVTVTNSNFTNNNAGGYGYSPSNYFKGAGCGGAIFVQTGIVTVNSSSFINNNVTSKIITYNAKSIETYGGAIYVNDGNVIVFDSNFINNTATNSDSTGTAYGGAIYTNNEISITNSVLINNTAKSGGNVIYAKTIKDVNGNWWGNNNPLSAGNNLIYNANTYITPGNWIIMNLTVSPTIFNPNDVSIVVVKFQTNNTENIVSDFEGNIPFRFLSLSSSGGTFNPDIYNITNTVNSIFTPEKFGSNYNISACIDNQILTIPIIYNFYVDSVKGNDTGGTGSEDKPYQTITKAVNTINEGILNNYTVNIAPGTYTESNIIFGKNITFTKTPNTNGEVIIDGNHSRIFDTGSCSIVLNNLTIINGNSTEISSVIRIITEGNINITNCKIENNTQTAYGGVISTNKGNVTCINSTFTNNTGNNYGGAIYIYNGSLNNINTNYTSNKAKNGGAIYIANGILNNMNTNYINNTADDEGGAIYFGVGQINNTNTIFTSNNATNGGAIFIMRSSSMEGESGNIINIINNNTNYINNKAIFNGGAINIDPSADMASNENLNINLNSKFMNNTADNEGGAIFIEHGNITCNNSIFKENNASYGGAIAIYNGNITCNNSIFKENNASYGGAITVYLGNINTITSNFTSNNASYGGAINIGYITVSNPICGSGNLTCTNTNFTNNTASYSGGAISIGYYNLIEGVSYCDGYGNITCINSIFKENNASYGGALYLNNGSLNSTNSTFIKNSGDRNIGNGGAIYINFGDSIIDNNKFINNYAAFGGTLYVQKGIVKSFYNNFTDNGAIFGSAVINIDTGNLSSFNDNFTNNSASFNSGALYINNGNVNITQSNFINNNGTWNGGALYISNGNLNVNESNFINNSVEKEKGGAIYIYCGNVTFNNSNFTSNYANTSGGAIYLFAGNITCSNTNFTSNNASRYGGAICMGNYDDASTNDYCNLNIINSTFKGNNASFGGALLLNKGKLNSTNSKFLNNNGDYGLGCAGAIYINEADAIITDNEFFNNYAIDSGVLFVNTGNVSCFNSKFMDNHANQGSGAITIWTGSLNSVNTNLTNNTASGSGAVYISTGNLNSTNSSFINNNASIGGAIYIRSGNITSNKSFFINNTAKNEEGGAIYIWNGSLISSQTIFTNNNANTSGGAIYIGTGNMTSINSNFNSNYANESGGAIILRSYGKIININTIFINNSADRGGAIEFGTGTINNTNTNFTNNNASTGGAIHMEGHDLLDKSSRKPNNIFNTNTNYINNTAKYNGGAINLDSVTSLEPRYGNIIDLNSKYINNTALSNGGALYVYTGNVSCSYSVFLNNSAVKGNAIYVEHKNENTYNFDYNWWGNNTPFSKDNNLIYVDNSYTPNNWVIMSLSAPSSVYAGKSSSVLVKFQTNSSTNNVQDLTGVLPSRVVIFNCSGGSVNPNSMDIVKSVSSTYNAGSALGTYNINATIDYQSLSIPITVSKEPTPTPPTPPTPPIPPVVVKVSTSINGEDITSNSSSVTFSVSLTSEKGESLSNKLVVFNFNSKKYNLNTDNEGVASLSLTDLKVGSYSVTYSFAGDSIYSSSSGSNTITIINNTKTDSKINCTYNDISKVLSFNLTSNNIPLSNQNITVQINASNIIVITNNKGLSSINLTNYTSGNYIIKYNYLGNNTVDGFNGTINITVTSTNMTNSTIATVLKINNFIEQVGAGKNLTGKLLDVYGNPIIGQHISLNLARLSDGASKVYWATTDTNGGYQLPINLYAGAYTVTATFGGNSKYDPSGPSLANITVKTGDLITTTLSANKFSEPYGAGDNFTGQLLNRETGAPIVGQHIALKLARLSDGASKVYWATTDTNGEYQLAINLYAGEYTAQCSYSGTSQYQASNASNTISVTA